MKTSTVQGTFKSVEESPDALDFHEFFPYSYAPLKIMLVTVGTPAALRRVSRLRGAAVGRRAHAYVDCGQWVVPDHETGYAHFHSDAEYFCMMVFARKHLSLGLVVHESVHASFTIAKRAVLDPWRSVYTFDEEHIAYPAANIADYVVRYYQEKGYL